MSLTERISSGHVESPLVRSGSVEVRLYQQTIAEKACEKNTLVVLPTALGKTIISALAAAHFLYNYKQKRILVMAPSQTYSSARRGAETVCDRIRRKLNARGTGPTACLMMSSSTASFST